VERGLQVFIRMTCGKRLAKPTYLIKTNTIVKRIKFVQYCIMPNIFLKKMLFLSESYKKYGKITFGS
jgi:hypothetical protein